MNEIWKDVVGYEDYFQVSNTGKIYSKRTNKELKQHTHKNGYKVFTTRFSGRNSKSKCFKVHILVAKAFIDNPENKPTVNHIDGNKINNHVNNLEWATHREQNIHAIDTGLATFKKGYDSPYSFLNEDDVKFIRENYKRGDKEFGCRALGERFNIAHSTISKVINNQ